MSASVPQWKAWFDTKFWPFYPRREKKIAAQDACRWAFQNHNGDGRLEERCEATLAWQFAAQPDWRFWTTPDKWFLGQRWTDEPPAKPMSEFERERAERHQRSLAQQMAHAMKREQAS